MLHYQTPRSTSQLRTDLDFKHGELFGPLTQPPPLIPKAPNPLPEEGTLLFERVGRQLKITRPNSSFTLLEWDDSEKMHRLIENEKVPPYKVDKVLNYVWSYRHAYVSLDDITAADVTKELFPWLAD